MDAGDDGATVLAISITDFDTLIRTALVEAVTVEELSVTDYEFVDVHTQQEFHHDGKHGALHIAR